MKRRVILLIGTFLILAAVVWIYHRISRAPWVLMPEGGTFPDMGFDLTRGEIGPDADRGWEVDVQDRPKGRLRGRYRARKWVKRGGGNYLLTSPNIVMYQSNGEHVYIRSDYGEVLAEEVGGGWTIRRGSLYGNVKIFLDRDLDRVMPEDEPEKFFVILEDRPSRVVRVYADNLRFNNDLLKIESDSRIAVLSDEADIYGRGLLIRWNEEPRELRELRILHGQYMAVYDIPAGMGVFSLPGAAEARAAADTQPATVPVEVTAATQVAATAPASAPPTQPTTTTAPASGPVARPASTTTQGAPATDVAATRPTRPASRPTTQPRNIFLAEFEGSYRRIHVDSGDQQLAGANKLALTFEWGTGRGRRAQASTRAPVATAPSQPTRGVPIVPVATVPSMPAGFVAASRPTQPTRPAMPGAEPVIITWGGPLTIKPIGYTATPSSRRYTVQAEGELKLSDARSSARCKRLVYQLPQQRGWLIADKDSNVRMDSGDDQEVVCRWLEFSRRTGTALLKGPGYMARRPKETGSSATTTPASATAPSGADWTVATGEDRITWGGTVKISFGQDEFVDEEGERHTRQFINNATFRDDVVLTQGRRGDFVKCDELYVEMARDENNRVYPRKAVAGGNVLAKQETSDIRAREVIVTFERQSVSGTDDVLVLRPVAMTAKGEVGITDSRDEEVMTASADRLTSDLVKRTAVLLGSDEQFATITQGQNYLAGDKVRLDDLAQSVEVDGRGELKFVSDRDLSGGKLPKPRPVRIEWDKGMTYAATGDTAEFDGNVALSSGLDSMKCRSMRVIFEKVTQEPKAEAETKPVEKTKAEAETKPADKAKDGTSGESDKPGRRLGISMQQYSRRKLSMIVADKDVVVRRREENKDKRLLQRLQMAGDKLIYDVTNSTIQVLGPGTLMAEDYRKPRDPEEKKAAEGPARGMERPWQTLFEWRKSMEYSQLERRVKLRDRVSMVHRSGKQVLMGEKLNVPDWKNIPIPPGRKAMLSCQELLAVFAEPKEEEAKDKEGKDKEAPEAFMDRGPRLGPLKLFTATEGVNLKDGPVQIMGERLVYELYELSKDGKTAEAVVWGSLPGKPVKNAKVYEEDPDAGKSRSWASPTITVYFEGRDIKEVVTKGVTGQGGT